MRHDPWHSQTNEVQFGHSPGWKVAVQRPTPKTRWGCCVGCAGEAGNDPVIFFESISVRCSTRPRRWQALYPGDGDYVLDFVDYARTVRDGDALTIVTLGRDGGALRRGVGGRRSVEIRSAHLDVDRGDGDGRARLGARRSNAALPGGA